MKFGAHVSIAGGIFNAPLNAAKIGCETFQFFSRSPRGGAAPAINKEIKEKFINNCQEHGFSSYYIHTPYYINFASTNNRIRKGSIEIVRQELERGDQLAVTATMTHLGSAKDIDDSEIVQKVAEGLIQVLKGYNGKNQFLIEIAAGAGKIIGSTFEEIAAIIKTVEKKVKYKIGVCFDTAHAFASGYDLRDQKSVNETLRQFAQSIGRDRLVVVHINDSLVSLGERKDRHANIGKGKIGINGFKSLLCHKWMRDMDFVLETPWETESTIKKDLNTLKRIRANQCK